MKLSKIFAALSTFAWLVVSTWIFWQVASFLVKHDFQSGWLFSLVGILLIFGISALLCNFGNVAFFAFLLPLYFVTDVFPFGLNSFYFLPIAYLSIILTTLFFRTKKTP
jgi:hypothetical protein